MDKHFCFLILTIFWGIMGPQCWAVTDILEVQTLQDLYRSLNSPMQLEHWKAESGDPCEETWKGVQCLGSSLITLDLHGLELTGNLGAELSNLKSLKHLDLSSNNIEGSIAYSLPPNVTHLILAENKLSGTIPYSIGKMKHLRHLNFSHNMLSGSLGDVFNGLENLKEMDLSFNYFTGNLPSSFRSLTNLTGLFLQNNQLTGSVIFLVNLSLTDLNIEDNYFSGMIPENFQNILNLRIAGNNFWAETNYGPWMFPSDTMPRNKDITRTPAADLIAIESHPSQSAIHKKRKQTFKIIIIIGAITLAAAFLIPMVIVHRQRSRLKRRRGTVSPGEPVSPHESVKSLSPDANLDHTSTSVQSGSDASSFSSSPTSTSSGSPPICTSSDSTWIKRTVSKRSFSMREVSTGPRMYSSKKLRIATNNFSKENFIGEGSLGSVYRAEFADGKVVAVKNIKTPSHIIGDQQFFDVIKNIFHLKHPNIMRLLGHSVDQSQHLLVYEFIRNFSLDEALHCVAHRPLPSCVRLQIALGIARALEYLHSSCVPPIAHNNLKAANILLDEELKPFVCDCDLAIFSSRVNPGDIEADVYAFGVLLLELLTGRKPIDSSRPKEEQSLVSWASSTLNDGVSFEHIVDPAITRAIPSRWLSRLADIVSLCIQPKQELRPTMSVIVGSLTPLLQRLTGLFEHGTDALAGAVEFSYDELVNATGSFSSECLIEDSYFWKVYKGTFANNKIYAVKHLENALLRRTDDQIVEEVSKLHNWSHPNLVRMIGYCIYDEKRYIITDFMPATSLASLLHHDSQPLDSPPLDWSDRMMIALHVARGLSYLHEEATCFIDLSSSTILVGVDMRIQLVDVWIARSFYMPSADYSLSPMDCYIAAADPYKCIEGYHPPMALFPWSSDKDVYTFGILLLVLITGKKACDHEFFDHLLIDRVRPIISEGRLEDLVDPDLQISNFTLQRVVDLALMCTLEDTDSRPPMSEVVDILESLGSG